MYFLFQISRRDCSEKGGAYCPCVWFGFGTVYGPKVLHLWGWTQCWQEWCHPGRNWRSPVIPIDILTHMAQLLPIFMETAMFADPPKKDKPRRCTQLIDMQDWEWDLTLEETGEPLSLKENDMMNWHWVETTNRCKLTHSRASECYRVRPTTM